MKTELTSFEFGQIEYFMEQLRSYLGGHRFCIVHGTAGELFTIGIYDNEGKMIKAETAINIQEACEKLIKQ